MISVPDLVVIIASEQIQNDCIKRMQLKLFTSNMEGKGLNHASVKYSSG